MAELKKRKKFLTLHRQVCLFYALASVIVITAIVLLLLRRDPIYSGEIEKKALLDASADIEASRERISSDQAELLTKAKDTRYKVQLVFEGFISPELNAYIVDLLGDYGMDAIFCASAVDAVENVESLKQVLSKGYRLGSYDLRGETQMQKLSEDELLDAFCTSALHIKDATGMRPRLLRCFHTENTPALRAIARACGYDELIETKNELDLQSFASFSSVQRYINSREAGSLVAFRLSAVTDALPRTASPAKPSSAPTLKPTAKPASSHKPPDKDADWVDMSALSNAECAKLIAEWLIRANAEAEYTPQAAVLLARNGGKTATLQKTLYTTKRGICLLLGNIKENNAELSSLLSKLKALNVNATFAVTHEEAKNCEAALRAVLAAGHSLEVAVHPGMNDDAYDLCSQIILCKELLRGRYGARPGRVCIALGSLDSPAMAEAASAAGCELFSYQSAMSQSPDTRSLSVDELLSRTFSNDAARLRRGHIFYFPLNHYEDPDTLGAVIERVYTERNIYPACALRALTDDTALRYAYPVSPDAYLPGVSDIGTGHIKNEGALMDLIAAHYLGCRNASSTENLPGFDDDERGRLNKIGLIETKEKIAFLTFDDWGTDANIDPLLTVLKAHGAKGVFFIRTNHVAANPNLLRAIAVDGHEVGSHTHEHRPLSAAMGDMRYASLTPEETAALAEDLNTSWYTLASVVGDIKLGARPALIKIFRPPTLAVSKEGLRTVFDMGFEYVASGSYSTHDYEAESAETLFKNLKENLKPGAVYVMHMSGEAKYTAQALELLFAYNESLPEAKRFSFPLLGEYLCDGVEVDHPY